VDHEVYLLPVPMVLNSLCWDSIVLLSVVRGFHRLDRSSRPLGTG
jgi:hypothetical protein